MSPRGNAISSLGVDVGGTKILGVALSDSGEIVESFRLPTPQVIDADVGGHPGSAVSQAIAQVISTLGKSTGAAIESCGIGVGVPGMVAVDGTLVFAPNLQGAIGANISTLVGEYLGREGVRIDNDANCAALAEHRIGAASGVDHALVLTLGTGIGGAVIVNGEILRGANGFAGEFGHMMVDRFGPQCPCGSRGCIERFASGSGLRHLAQVALSEGRIASGEAESPEALLTAAAGASAGALQVVDEFCWWVAQAIANLVACFDPRVVVLGGGVIEAHSLIMEPTRRHLAAAIEGHDFRSPPLLVPTMLGKDAGAVGAALLGEKGRS